MAQLKTYSFNSVGTKKESFDQQQKAAVTSPPIGIKTPLELGNSDDGIFKMHRSLADFSCRHPEPRVPFGNHLAITQAEKLGNRRLGWRRRNG